ncbi:hypothetical protein SCYAM73S_06773 [Streptomyces cyaneofuscatus]
MRRRSLPTFAVLLTLALGSLGAAPADSPPPLPYRLADTGGGSQLITAEAPDTASTTGTVTWWERRGGRWVAAGSAPARFGANGLADGATREQGTSTTTWVETASTTAGWAWPRALTAMPPTKSR